MSTNRKEASYTGAPWYRKTQQSPSVPTLEITKLREWNQCLCLTYNCSNISAALRDLAPRDHVWNAPKFEIERVISSEDKVRKLIPDLTIIQVRVER